MIPDRVHCSWRERVGLMAALKFIRWRMIEPEIIFALPLSLDFRSRHCALSLPLPIASIMHIISPAAAGAVPWLFSKSTSALHQKVSCKCKHVGSQSKVAADFTLSFFSVVVMKKESGSSSRHQTAAIILSDEKKKKKLSLQARRQAFIPHWEFFFAVQPHRTRLKDKCCCVTALFTRVHNGAV